MKNEDLIQRIRAAMDYARLTQADLARACGVSEQAVGKWFKRGTVSKASLEKIAARAKVSLGWLLSGVGQMVPTAGGAEDYPPYMSELLTIMEALPPAARYRVMAVAHDEAEKAEGAKGMDAKNIKLEQKA